MAATPGRAALGIAAPANNNANIVHNVRRANPRRHITYVLLFVPVGGFTFLLIFNIFINIGNLEIEYVDISHMDANFDKINNNTAAIKANISLQVRLHTKGLINPSPDLGTFTLTTGVLTQNNKITAFSNSSFILSETEQRLDLFFEVNKTNLTEEQMSIIEEMGLYGNIWMNLIGNFNWHLVLRKIQFLKKNERRSQFSCNIPNGMLPIIGTEKMKCW